MNKANPTIPKTYGLKNITFKIFEKTEMCSFFPL